MAMDERLLCAAESGDTTVLQRYIDRGDLFTATDAGGSTVAHLSAKFGHAEFLLPAVRKNPSLLVKVNSDGDTPFHYAARFGNKSCLASLIGTVRDIPPGDENSEIVEVQPGSLVDVLEMRNRSGDTPLHEAIRGCHEDIVKLLFDVDPNSINIEANNAGESPLYLASSMTLIVTVTLLLGDGTQQKNFEGLNGKTALHAAVCRCDQGGFEVARLLLNHRGRGLDLTTEKDNSGNTPMHYVASIGNLRMAKLLLSYSIDSVFVLDKKGLSPLHVAATMGHIHIIEVIIRHQPHTATLLNKEGRTFLHLAVEHKVKGVIRYVRKTSALQPLLNMTDSEGNTPFHVANGGNREIVDMFLAMDEKLHRAALSGNTSVLPDIRDDLLDMVTADGNTVAHLSAKFGHVEFLTEVANRRCSLLAKVNSDGDTPFHYAARFGNLSCVDSLICIRNHSLQEARRHSVIRRPQPAGVRPDSLVHVLKMRNKRGNTSLHEAIRGRHEDIVKSLFHADPDSAKISNNVGESPLYLASNMTLIDTVELLLEDGSGQPNFDGPHGKTALHAAVCRDKDGFEVVQLLLNHGNMDLRIKRDDSGSTPMHYVASKGDLTMAELLLNDYDSVVVLIDNNGLSPLHVAATMGHIPIIQEILCRRPDVADLRDNKGRTFLHLVVDHDVEVVIRYALKIRELESLLNMQDSEGNTPIHLAVNGGRRTILRMFLANEKVDTSITNDSGMTPLDLASSIAETSLKLRKYKMMRDLLLAGSKRNPQRFDLAMKERKRPEEEEIHRYRDIVQNLTITSVLIATVTFAAAFTLPGGYREDNGSSDTPQIASIGTALLARNIAFKIFLLSDAIAMATSLIIAVILIQTGTWDHDIRSFTIRLSLKLMWLAMGGMVMAFATGTYLTVASDSIGIAISIIVISCSVPIVIYLLQRFPYLHKYTFIHKIYGYFHDKMKKTDNFLTPQEAYCHGCCNFPTPQEAYCYGCCCSCCKLNSNFMFGK